MTDKQVRYIKFLANTRIMTADVKERLLQALDRGMDFVQTDRTIKWLLSQPEFPSRQPAAPVEARPQIQTQESYGHRDQLPDVKEGRYAVENDGVLKFYRVDRPADGKWAGRTFVSVQASDDFHPIKAWDSKVQILNLIAADPKEAMLRYGKELGKCGHCGRTLTNEESRQYGIGPICREGVGW